MATGAGGSRGPIIDVEEVDVMPPIIVDSVPTDGTVVEESET